MSRRLGAVSAAMLDHAERRVLERQRIDQIRIEKQWRAPRKRSQNCRNGRHKDCFSVNCPCKCHEEVE